MRKGTAPKTGELPGNIYPSAGDVLAKPVKSRIGKIHDFSLQKEVYSCIHNQEEANENQQITFHFFFFT